MVTDIDLHALADIHGPERAVLTLYLSSKGSLPWLEERAERIRALLDDEGEREHFAENLRMLEEFLAEYDFHAPALCVVSCWALDFFHAYPLEVPVEDLLRVDAAPYLRPLAEIQDEGERFAVVAANNTVTRIFLVTAERPIERKRVRGDIKNDVRKGGQSQKRYERRRENALMHYAKEVVAELERLAAHAPFGRLVLLGSEEATLEIRDELTPTLRKKLVEREAIDLSDEEVLWQAAYDAFEGEERAEERELWERIEAAYLGHGRATLGPAETLAAAAAGRVERLLVTRDAKVPGSRCRECDNPSPGAHDACPVCGSDGVFPIDLINELVDLTERFGARVEFADPIPGLSKNGDVAALLRY